MDLTKLDPFIMDRIQQLVEQEYLTYNDVDSRLVSELLRSSQAAGLQTLQEFSQSDRSSVKNISGYLYGILKRLAKTFPGILP